jgi:[ribosomal protein S5]-alanine N-acetyltransferase
MNMSFDIPTRLETERLILRCYQAGDGPMYFGAAQRNREHLQEFESGNALMSLQSAEQAEAVVRELAAYWVERRCFFWGVFAKETGEFVAQVYVGPVNWETPEFEIGYIADRDHQGQGLVSEAVRAVLGWLFETLQAHRVRLECSEDNLRSIKVAERCGFIREGHLRETKRRPDGQFSGDLIYGMLRSTYDRLPK